MKQFILWIFLALVPAPLFAGAYYCASCNSSVDKLYPLRGIAGETNMVCAVCYQDTPHCTVCRRPVKKQAFKKLDDGRIICETDVMAGIFSQPALDDIARETRRELERVFYRFGMKFPETNVTVQLVSADRLYQIVGAPYNPTTPEINGFTVPTYFDGAGTEIPLKLVMDGAVRPARAEYKIYVISGLPKARVKAVCAHEWGHVWHSENLPLARTYRLEATTREAFCELIAYQLMSYEFQSLEKAVIQANLYTQGQSELLLDIDKDYGFNRVLQWMKYGTDLRLTRAQLDRVRLVNGSPSSGPASEEAASLFGDGPAATIPDTLMLKGIMGTGSKRMVMINNQSFFASETAKVKVGTTSVAVQVVEIRDKSVVIRTNGTAQTSELFLTQ